MGLFPCMGQDSDTLWAFFNPTKGEDGSGISCGPVDRRGDCQEGSRRDTGGLRSRTRSRLASLPAVQGPAPCSLLQSLKIETGLTFSPFPILS